MQDGPDSQFEDESFSQYFADRAKSKIRRVRGMLVTDEEEV